MKASIEIDLSFNQILAVVKQLPRQQKIRLTKELEKEAIDTRLSKLLKTFNSEDLDMNLIDEEVERVRQQIYDQKKR
ncbi:type II toxin-antitoxin system VapB15 family antitoxin [Flavobacterium sp.]|uniref:type II toxin-antitoxin system VapB15 family antitoxin n=1 Tax=Flavobacterium sp. TaxID=239 RepID=UPI003B99BFD6